MKKKVLLFSLDKRDTTAFWRSSWYRFMYSQEFEVIDISDNKIFDWTTFLGTQILWIQRPFGVEHAQVMQAAKNMGLKVIADYDDMLLDAVDMYNPTHQLYKQHQNSLKSCLSIADEIWASTDAIKQSYSSYCNNIHVIPNAHNDYLFKIADKKPFNPVLRNVFWRGGTSHDADVNEVADNLIATINENKNWTFGFMGSRFTYIEQRTGDNHHIIQGMSIMEYFRYVNEINPQIMIFPLCDTKFNRGKSNISFIESSYAGASFYGNKKLPEFNFDFISDISTLSYTLNSTNHELMNKLSWEYITDCLLLSEINLIREERILANI